MKRVILLTICITTAFLLGATAAIYNFFGDNIRSYSRIKVPVFMYHSISDTPVGEDENLSIGVEKFENQLKYFEKSGIKTIFASEFSNKYSEHAVVITFDDGYENNYINVFPLLKKYKFKATIFVATNLIGKPGYLTEGQIREMSESGYVEFGSHTHNHVNLDQCKSEQEVETELKVSKETLEKITGKKIDVMSYPGGYYDNTTICIAKKYYKKAFVDRFISRDYIYSGNYTISRYGVYNTTDSSEIEIVSKRVINESNKLEDSK